MTSKLEGTLGVDWFSFQTSIRKLVLELIEPTIKRTFDDHELVQALNFSYEKLKKRQEDFEYATTKQLNRAVTLDDLAKKQIEMEKQRSKSEEKLWAEISKQMSHQEYIREKLTSFFIVISVQQKTNESIQVEVNQLERQVDQMKADLHQEILKQSQNNHQLQLEFNQRLSYNIEQLRLFKSHLDNYNDTLLQQQVEMQTYNYKLEDLKYQANEEAQQQVALIMKNIERDMHRLRIEFGEEIRNGLKQMHQRVMKDLIGDQDPNDEEDQNEDQVLDQKYHMIQIEGLDINYQRYKSEKMIKYNGFREEIKFRKQRAKSIGESIFVKYKFEKQEQLRTSTIPQDFIKVENIDRQDDLQEKNILNETAILISDSNLDNPVRKRTMNQQLKNTQSTDQRRLGDINHEQQQNKLITEDKQNQNHQTLQSQRITDDAQDKQSTQNLYVKQLTHVNINKQATSVNKKKKQILSLDQIWEYIQSQLDDYLKDNELLTQIIQNNIQSKQNELIIPNNNTFSLLDQEQSFKDQQSLLNNNLQTLPFDRNFTQRITNSGLMNNNNNILGLPTNINDQLKPQRTLQQPLTVINVAKDQNIQNNNFNQLYQPINNLGTQNLQSNKADGVSQQYIQNEVRNQFKKAKDEIVSQINSLRNEMESIKYDANKRFQSNANDSSQQNNNDYLQQEIKDLSNKLQDIIQSNNEQKIQLKSQIQDEVQVLDKKIQSQIMRVTDMIKRYKAPTLQQIQSQEFPAQNQALDLTQVEIMIQESKQDLRNELEQDLSRLQVKITSQLQVDNMRSIKEELKFWSDTQKKELHYEIGQLRKEIINNINAIDKTVQQLKEKTQIQIIPRRQEEEFSRAKNNKEPEKQIQIEQSKDQINITDQTKFLNDLVNQIQENQDKIYYEIQTEQNKIKEQINQLSGQYNRIQSILNQLSNQIEQLKQSHKTVENNKGQEIEMVQNEISLSQQNQQQVEQSKPSVIDQIDEKLEQQKLELNSAIQKKDYQNQESMRLEQINFYENNFNNQYQNNQIQEERLKSIEDKQTQYEIILNQIQDQLQIHSQQLQMLSNNNLAIFIQQQVLKLIPKQDIDYMQSSLRTFKQQISDSVMLIEDKLKVLENLENDLERGVKRNARDKTDYLLQMKQIQNSNDKQMKEFRDQINEFQLVIDTIKSEQQNHMISVRVNDANMGDNQIDQDAKEQTLQQADLENEFRVGMRKGSGNEVTHKMRGKQQDQIYLPSVNKHASSSQYEQFKMKKSERRVQSSEMADLSINNSQINIASVLNLQSDFRKQQNNSMLQTKEKTVTLLNQNPLHNYSQVIDPLAMLKASNQQKHKHNASIDLSSLNLSQRERMPNINKNQPINAQSTLQIANNTINWENAKIRDSSRILSQMQQNKSQYSKAVNLHSDQSSPIRLQALIALVSSYVLAHKAALDDEDIFPDTENEEGIKAQNLNQQKEENIQIPNTPVDHVPVNPTPAYYINKYQYELVWCVVFIITLAVFFSGRSSNDNVAQQWKKACSEAISSNFAHFGVTKEPSTSLEKISYSEYHYYASGRQNCMYALFKFDLKKRHCLFTTLGIELIWPKKDQVVIEIPIVVPEYQLPDGGTANSIPLELVICKLRDIKTIQGQLPYLKRFVAPIQSKSYQVKPDDKNSLVLFAESTEAANHIIDNEIGSVLLKMGAANIQEIHVTDQKVYNNFPLFLKATLNIDPSEDRLKESARLVKALLTMVDRIVTLRLSREARSKCEKNRKEAEKLRAKDKNEEVEEQKLQKKREEERKYQEMLKKLPPDEQRKLEEKKRIKDMQKQRSRMAKIVKF